MKWIVFVYSISALMLSSCEAKKSVSKRIVRFQTHAPILHQDDSLRFELSDLSAQLRLQLISKIFHFIGNEASLIEWCCHEEPGFLSW